ncbi:trypsin-like peptidase domain-containing protein [bacterium]|nr:trypsin-like peptidase domain-containing protein [bacterium]
MFKKRVGSVVIAVGLILFSFTTLTMAEEKISPAKGKIDFSVLKDKVLSKKCYDLSDFYQLGVISFYDEAKSRGDTFVKMVRETRSSVGRLYVFDITRKFLLKEWTKKEGTAVFLSKDYVLTAGHCVESAKKKKSAPSIRIVTVEGAICEAKVVASLYEGFEKDWAVLKLLKSYKGTTPPIGKYKKGDEVIIMGYPQSHIHDENYRIHPGDVLFDVDTMNVVSKREGYPIPLIGKVIGENRVVLIVGSDVLDGYSGSPVFSHLGEIIGIVTGHGGVVSSNLGNLGVAKPEIQKFIRFCPIEKIIKKCPELKNIE